MENPDRTGPGVSPGSAAFATAGAVSGKEGKIRLGDRIRLHLQPVSGAADGPDSDGTWSSPWSCDNRIGCLPVAGFRDQPTAAPGSEELAAVAGTLCMGIVP